jgi:hypothetical protein
MNHNPWLNATRTPTRFTVPTRPKPTSWWAGAARENWNATVESKQRDIQAGRFGDTWHLAGGTNDKGAFRVKGKPKTEAL